MKATQLITLLQEEVDKHGSDIDVMTFSGELGIYKQIDEVNRISIRD